MINTIIAIIGLFFLLVMSLVDVKKQEIPHYLINIFAGLSLIFLFFHHWTIIIYIIIWFLIGFLLFYYDCMGGADTKILAILPIYYLINMPNYFTGYIFFLTIFILCSIPYVILSKKINKKNKIPFIPFITLIYVLFWIFRLISF